MAGENIIVFAPEEFNIKIVKWRIREGVTVNNSQVLLLYEIANSNNKEIKKLKSSKIGVVKKRLYKDGAFVDKGAPLLELSECIHTTVIKDMCADCGADLRQNENGNTSEASVPMIHSVPELKVTQQLAQKLGEADTRRLLEDRKLVLLVDLDQTLIHTKNDNVPSNIKGVYHFRLYGPHSPWYHTKLRPGTIEFLSKIAEYYELHICTFGARNYAHMIAQFLDPDGKFFSHRILSRDECFNATSKTDNLKALFPCGDSMVCIIDDREDVWNMASNLIQVKPYHFFQHTGDINAPPVLGRNELEEKNVNLAELKKLTEERLNDTINCTKTEDKLTKDEGKQSTEESENEIITKAESQNEMKTIENEDEKIIVEEENIIVEEDNKTLVENIVNSNLDSEETRTKSILDEEKKDVELENSKNAENAENHQKENGESENKQESENEINKEVLVQDENKMNEENKDSDKDVCDAKEMEIRERFEGCDLIDVEDPDDYLLYLEAILKTIHKRFYAIHDETKDIPDLKLLIPQIRSEILRGCNLVFSGLVPTQMKLEQSRAYLIARGLGANVYQSIATDTTHLVAVTAGTFKVNAARKRRDIHIVTPDWLWCCAERWERCDEKLFPLDPNKPSKMRQPPLHCQSPEHVINYGDKPEYTTFKPGPKFIDTINPLLSFSNADIAEMNQEFDQFFESDSSSEEEAINIENPPVEKKLLKRKRDEESEERGRKFFMREEVENPFVSDEIMENERIDEDDDVEKKSSDNETLSEKFRRGEDLPDLDVDNKSDSEGSESPLDGEDDGDWNMMGAALEREFLGLED